MYPVYSWKTVEDTPFMRKWIPRLCVENLRDSRLDVDMAAQRGWSIEETANKLMEVSARAQERARLYDEGYALITAQNAAAAAARGRQTGRG
jgi:hypothetical protein